MREIGTAILLLLCVYGCRQDTASTRVSSGERFSLSSGKVAMAEPVLKEYNFGELKSGDSIEYVFQLRNTGAIPVIIQNVRASCGCTTVDWMKRPVRPGEVGWIRSRLRAVDKGRIRKSVVAQLNTAGHFMVFYLAGDIIPGKAPAIK